MERTFHYLEHTFHCLERTFHCLEHKIPVKKILLYHWCITNYPLCVKAVSVMRFFHPYEVCFSPLPFYDMS